MSDARYRCAADPGGREPGSRSRRGPYAGSSAGSDSGPAGEAGDFQASVARLERAVDELVSTARSQVSDRASSFIDDTTRRLERELDRRQRIRSRRDPSPGGRSSRRRLRYPDLDGLPRRLYRDPSREKIVGVCAGIARYYGVEPWVVRCVAVTGLLFFPTIVFPAYWIAYFVMEKPPGLDGDGSDRRRTRRQRGRHAGGRYEEAEEARFDHRSPAQELGPRLSPRYSLRNVQADLTEVELRLRRMESHVTSGRYELQRELHKIDGGTDGAR